MCLLEPPVFVPYSLDGKKRDLTNNPVHPRVHGEITKPSRKPFTMVNNDICLISASLKVLNNVRYPSRFQSKENQVDDSLLYKCVFAII